MQKAPKKILAIDDEQDLLDILTITLKSEGFQVITAANGVEGMQLALEHKPDLILLDIMMPEMNGLHLLQRLNMSPSTKKTPIILLSAYGAVDNIFTAQKYRAKDFIIKPFEMDELLDVVYRHL